MEQSFVRQSNFAARVAHSRQMFYYSSYSPLIHEGLHVLLVHF